MRRKILLLSCLLLVLVGALAGLYFETGIRRGIEMAGTKALGTPVTVASVSLSPLSGRGTISGLVIGNPEGYSAPYAIAIGSLQVQLNIMSLFSDVIEITSVVAQDVQVSFETHVVTDNIRTLAEYAAGPPVTDATESGEQGRRVVIRELLIVDPQISIHALVVSAPVPLPDIHMQNIGEEGDGLRAREVAQEILAALNSALLNANIPDLNNLLDGAQQQLKEGASALGNTIENLGDGLRTLFNSSGQSQN